MLTVYMNENLIWFTLFIGVNLIQLAFTKWCLLEMILKKLCIKYHFT
ncbi:YgaP-like transmembrane domain [Formosa agariphila]|nr:YgaP-like transmembrane domain [Formosa agariphila]